MPLVNNPIPTNLDQLLIGGVASPEEREQQIAEHNVTMRELLTLGIPSTAIGIVDSLAQMVLPDSVFNEETMNAHLENVSKPLADFRRKNALGVSLVSETASMFVPILGATKLIRSGGLLDKAFDGKKNGELLKMIFI